MGSGPLQYQQFQKNILKVLKNDRNKHFRICVNLKNVIFSPKSFLKKDPGFEYL